MVDRQHASHVPRPAAQQPVPRSEPVIHTSEPTHHSDGTARASATNRLLKGPPAVRLSVSPAPPGSSGWSAGTPLPPVTRQRLESSFKIDLSSVRVHADAHAAGVADSISAHAFAYGSHIYLGTGQNPYNLGLMAHEVTHVVQQQGRPGVQMSSPFGASDGFEREAQGVSVAVVRGEPAVVRERTSFPRFQGSIFSRIGSGLRSVGRAIASGASAVVSAVAEIGAGLLNAAYNFLREHARQIPGYDLLAFILGRDPITQQPVERNASNLIHGVLGLIPGGAAMWENLQRANVTNRVFDWLNAEIAKLNLTWAMIRGLFQQAWEAFSLAEAVAHPIRVFERIRDIFAPALGRLVNFARAVGGKILEFIFEGALALGGGAAQRVLGIFRRAQAVFSLIVNDPVGFVRNLIAAGVGGFRRFAANILDHLRTALFEWLFGALTGAGLQLPTRWDLMGILGLVLQILGLTYARMRERMVRLIGEPAVRAIEVAFEFIQIIVTRGLGAAWEKILEFATGMIDTVIEGIRNWVITSIVRAAVTRLATMFNPAGAIIQAIIAVYNTVMFFIERAQQIAAMVESYLNSIENIARGNLGAAITYVERAMARTLPVIISFLARLIGLGGISDTIRSIIHRIQATVDRAIDRVIEWVRTRAAGILARVTGRGGAAAGPDTRTVEQKTADLRAAVGQANTVARNQQLNQRQKTRQFNEIKTRYRLNSLEIITDRVTGLQETDHVRAVINPTYDGDGYIINRWPPEPRVIIQTTIGAPQPREGFEEVLEPISNLQRAHLVGAGFGRESPLGVFHAPEDVNQRLQNRGIERYIRGLYRRRYPGVEFFLIADAEPHPGTTLLARVHYRLFGQRPGEPRVQLLELEIRVANYATGPTTTVAVGDINLEEIRDMSGYLRQLNIT